MKSLNIESGQFKSAGMPMQAMPVERHMTGGAAVSGDMGVEASGWWDILKNVAQTALPIANGLVSRL